MILRELSNNEIAGTIGCSVRAVRRIRARLQRYGTTTSPSNRVGRERKITPLMRDALFEQLAKRPDMFREEMIRFLNGGFGVEVSFTTMSRMLKTERWSRKTKMSIRNLFPSGRRWLHAISWSSTTSLSISNSME
jgi:transposase